MRNLPPNIFAVVMATGIVALAVNAAGWPAGGHALFWVGLATYGVLWALTAARCVRHWPAVRADLTPPYWINMGAMAISTLGGVALVSASRGSDSLAELLPFLKGLTLMFWATATWWLPLLLMLGAWRHGVKGYPLTYDHGYWGAVFPLGMYAVCTLRLAREFGLPFLTPLGEAFAWVSLAAWAATAVGLARHITPRRRNAATFPAEHTPGGEKPSAAGGRNPGGP